MFEPVSSVQVSVAVLASPLTQCPFAVKSGGHAAFASASSIENGDVHSLPDLIVTDSIGRCINLASKVQSY